MTNQILTIDGGFIKIQLTANQCATVAGAIQSAIRAELGATDEWRTMAALFTLAGVCITLRANLAEDDATTAGTDLDKLSLQVMG